MRLTLVKRRPRLLVQGDLFELMSELLIAISRLVDPMVFVITHAKVFEVFSHSCGFGNRVAYKAWVVQRGWGVMSSGCAMPDIPAISQSR